MKDIKRLVGVIGKWKRRMFLLMLVVIAASLAGSVGWSPLIKWLIDKMPAAIPNADKYRIIAVCITAIFSLSIIEIISEWILAKYGTVVTSNIRKDLTESVFRKLGTMGFGFFDKNKTGELSTVCTEDCDNVSYSIWEMCVSLIKTITYFIGGTVVILAVNPILFIVAVPLITGMFLFQLFQVKHVKASHKQVREAKSKGNVFIHDKIMGIRTVQSFDRQAEEQEVLNGLMNEFVEKKINRFIVQAKMNMGIIAFVDVIYGMILVLGALITIKTDLTFAEVMLVYTYANNIINPVLNLVDVYDRMAEAIVGLDKIEAILNTKSEVSDEGFISNIKSNDIEFNDVEFKYQGIDVPILNHFNLKIKSGEYVALVGASGSGKSTIAGLIPRYYDIDNGAIRIGGVNLKNYSLSVLRKAVGVVQQDNYMFAGTILDNIKYGNPDASMEEVIEASRKANAHEFISKLQDGYNSEIGERGVKLSGGQLQRIAIARIFLANPKIIILDEATSALDNISEKLVQEAFEELSKGRTTIVIAHRLSTIKNADRILVLSDGMIIEEGSHDELIKKDGVYAHLYKSESK